MEYHSSIFLSAIIDPVHQFWRRLQMMVGYLHHKIFWDLPVQLLYGVIFPKE